MINPNYIPQVGNVFGFIISLLRISYETSKGGIYSCPCVFNILPDIKIDIDEDMQSMMIVLNDETIIKSLDYYIPAEIRKQYKG